VSVRRRWWAVPQEKAEQIRKYLLEQAEPEPASLGPTEQWRIRSSGLTVQYWDNGTLYCVGSASKESEAKNAWALIESVAGPPFVPTERPVMLGLDETGKGELAGPMTLAVAWVPEALAKQIERIVGLARTKEHRPPAYWERLFVALTPLTEQGVDFQIEQIPPWKLDRYDPYGSPRRDVPASPDRVHPKNRSGPVPGGRRRLRGGPHVRPVPPRA